MKTELTAKAAADIDTDLLVLPALAADWQEAVKPLDRLLRGKLVKEAQRRSFTAKADTCVLFQIHGMLSASDLLLVGLGDPAPIASWQQLADLAVRTAREVKARRLAFQLRELASTQAVAALVEGVMLADYRFAAYRSGPFPDPLEALTLAVPATSGDLAAEVKSATTRAEAACFARDLVNTPAADLTPAILAERARELAASGLAVKVHDRRAITRLAMGALLAVAQGSANEPRFIELVYRPARKTARCVALVGKGITFDSGGLCIKTADSMRVQKRDMAGAAVVLAAMRALPQLQPRVEVRGYIAAAENMPSGTAMRPGDVVRACNGKTIEVLNTDAEGRLVLADALAYAARLRPHCMIDFATLTAAVHSALGGRYAAIMGTDPRLVRAFIRSGAEANEKLWELPLAGEYRRDIDSSIADLKNMGEGQAGTIIGGLFLREFVGDVPWAHIDFSSTAFSNGYPCHPQGASGFGARMVLRYLTSPVAGE